MKSKIKTYFLWFRWNDSFVYSVHTNHVNQYVYTLCWWSLRRKPKSNDILVYAIYIQCLILFGIRISPMLCKCLVKRFPFSLVRSNRLEVVECSPIHFWKWSYEVDQIRVTHSFHVEFCKVRSLVFNFVHVLGTKCLVAEERSRSPFYQSHSFTSAFVVVERKKNMGSFCIYFTLCRLFIRSFYARF